MTRVAIVGGGPGGLFSALLLKQKCAAAPEITLFEASPRLGGKVCTKRFESAPVPYEAGAAELYQYGQDPLRLLLKEMLGLPVVRMDGRAVVMDGHILRSLEDVERHYGRDTVRALEQFDKLAHDARPYAGFYDGGWTADNEHPLAGRSLESLLDEVPDAAARRYLKVLIHSDLASEPHNVNALYGIDNYLINDPRYCKLYAIRDGMERMIDALRRAVDARVLVSTPVDRIEKGVDERSRVTYRQGGLPRSEEFDAVVVALPHSWLSLIGWGGTRLSSAVEAHLAHYDYPAHYLRISVLFRRSFWREEFDQSYFMLDAFGGCCVYDEGARHDTGEYGVLAWLLAGRNAFAASNLSDERLVEMALDSLPDEIKDGRGLFLEGRVHRWLGSVSARPGGRTLKGLEERHILEPVEHSRLFVVGDYMFDTSINGALDSADFATDLLIERLALPTRGVDNDYFDDYCQGESYADSYEETFDPEFILNAIAVAWGEKPPYKLLDVGAACGLTLRAFDKLGIEAWGVENNPYIRAQTPKRWRARNHEGDVRSLPFEDDAFDFVFDTALAYLPEDDIPQALAELHRVARKGVVFGSFATDLRQDAVAAYNLDYGVRTRRNTAEWAELFARHGFEPAITGPRQAERLWRRKTRAFGGNHAESSLQALSLRFFTKLRRTNIIRLPATVPPVLPAAARLTR